MKAPIGKLVRQVWPVVLFAAAMAYLESAVVVYLRDILGMGDSVFPALRIFDPKVDWLLTIEVGREAATMAMLLGVAFAAGRTRVQWWAVLIIAFGTWDIFYLSLIHI